MSENDKTRPAGPADTETESVRQGRTFGSVRWVLGLSLAMVVLGLAAVWMVMAP